MSSVSSARLGVLVAITVTYMSTLSYAYVFSDVMGPQMTSDVLSGASTMHSSDDVSQPAVDLQPVTHPRNLFHQYMTRGLYQCSSKYVHSLSKLQALIKEAFEEYTACEMELKKNPGPKSTENAFLDQLLNELDDDEDVQPTPSKRSRVLRILGARR